MKTLLSIQGIDLRYHVSDQSEKVDYIVSLSGELQQLSDVLVTCPTEPEVTLRAVYVPFYGGKLYIIDLAGNGEGSGLESRGIGTLLLNTAVQLFQRSCSETTPIAGEMIDVDDPLEDKERARMCRERRSCFLTAFGFSVKAGYPWNTFSGVLKDVRLRTEPVLIGGIFPRFVKVDPDNFPDTEV